MAQPTVRIHPPKRGDEEWLASMIAPLLDHASDLLVQGFAMGPISVGEGLTTEEADDLVDVLKGFGAQAERIDGQQRAAPAPRRTPAAPLPSQTQPFDGGHLRRMLAASAPTAHAPQRSGRPAATVQPPVRRSAPAMAPPRPASSPVASPSARPSAGPPPRVSGAVSSTSSAPPAPESRPSGARGAPSISTSPGSARSAARGRSSGSIAAGSPSVRAPKMQMPTGKTGPVGRPVHTSKAPTSLNTSDRPSGDVPPWFPQVPMRPDEEARPEGARDRSWLWFVLIITLAGAAAWYLQTRVA